MTILDEMTLYWSERVATGIVNKTIILLESKYDLLQNDTCLSNNWEGFCVQVQTQDEASTIDWDTGMVVIRSFFQRYYEALEKEEQFTVWLQTEKGQAWCSQIDSKHIDSKHSDTFEYNVAPMNFNDCILLLMTALIEVAMDFKNDNIINYMEYDCNGIEMYDEDDDYEDEEEDYEE